MRLLTHFRAISITGLSTIAGTICLVSPGQAATFSSVYGEFWFDNFSHAPLNVETEAFAETETVNQGKGTVTADSNAGAEFTEMPDPDVCAPFGYFACNVIVSSAFGEGSNYFGQAMSEAKLRGEFLVGQEETFSFDFGGSLVLATSVDDENTESSLAAGSLGFALLGRSMFPKAETRFLDGLRLVATLDTPGDDDDLTTNLFRLLLRDQLDDKFQKFNSPFSFNDFSYTKELGGSQELLAVNFEGSYNRKFFAPTKITLIEEKAGLAEVQQVPAPSMLWGLITMGGLSLRKKRHIKAESEAN
jgi:hypothetical protein